MAHVQNPSTEQSGWEAGQSWLEKHLPFHLGQANVERKKEERRLTMSKVLIASRSVGDCDLQVVAEGIYSQTGVAHLLRLF